MICQWYLDAALASAYRDTGDFDDNLLTKASQFWQYQQPPTGAPIDLFYLFDSTLAHEASITLGSILASIPPLMRMAQIFHTWIGNNRLDVAGLNSYGGQQHLMKARVLQR